MPDGIIVNCLSVVTGGLGGLLLKKVLPENLKKTLLVYFGFGALIIGITAIVKLKSLPIVVLSLIIGSIIGELLNLDGRLKKSLTRLLNRTALKEDKEKEDIIVILIAIFCFSGTGMFGVFNEGFLGDSSVLYAKSALDFFTAMIFSSSVGALVSLIAVPQFIVFILLYFLARLLGPVLLENTIANFISIGGIITLKIGFNISKIKEIKVINTIPSFVIVILLSQLLNNVL